MSRLDDIIEEGKRQGTKWQQSQLHFGGGVRDIWCKHIWTPLLYRGMNHIWPFYSTLCILSIHLLKTLLGPRTFSYVYLNRHLFSSSVVAQSCWYTLEACVSGIIVSSRRAVFSKLLISWDFYSLLEFTTEHLDGSRILFECYSLSEDRRWPHTSLYDTVNPLIATFKHSK